MASRKDNSKKVKSGSPPLLTSPGDQIGRLLAGEALGTSESFLHGILDQSPYPMWIADDQGTLIWLNQACRDLLHLTAAEVVGKYNVFQDNVVEQQGVLPLVRRVFEKGETVRFEITYDTSRLKTLPLSTTASVMLDVTVSPIMDSHGRITNAVFQHVDITERKRAEEALKKEKLFTEAILDSLPGTFFLLDAQGKHLRTNTSGLMASGYSLEEMSRLHALDFIADEDKPAAQRALAEVFENGKTSIEAQHLAKDGRKTPFLFSAKKFLIDGMPYIIGSGMDITARKQAEAALRESEKKYRSLYHEFQGILNAIPDILCLLSPDLKIVWGNEATAIQVGQSGITEIIGKHCYPLRHERSEPCENCPVLRCFGSGKIETEEVVSFGVLWELRAVPVYDDQGELVGAVEVARNITARKRIEKALQESEEQLRLALQAANQGFYDLNIQTGESKVSPEYATMLGYDPGKFQETNARWIERLHPDDREQVAATYQAYIREDIPDFAVEFRQRTRSGHWKWILSLGKIVAWDEDGKPLRMLGTLTDITERKNAEDALRESEKRLKEAQEMAHLGFWYWDVKTGDVTWSEEVYKIFQLDPKEFTPHIDSILELSPWPGDHERNQELIGKAMESHEKGAYEQRFLLPDQSIGYYYSTFQGKYDEGGNLIFIVGTVLDITERKQAEEALRESEARFRQVVESSPLPMGIGTEDGRVEYVNPRFVETLGYTLEDLPHMEDWFRLAYPDPAYRQSLLLKWQKAWERIKENGVTEVVEVEIACKDGSKRIMQLFGTLMDNKSLVVFNDLTDRKRAEEALRESETRFRQVVEHSPLPIAIVNGDQGEYVNPKFVETLGYTLEDLPRLADWFRLAYPDPDYRQSIMEKWQKALEEAIVGNQTIQSLEVQVTCKDGSVRTMEIWGVLVGSKILFFCTDLTERKRAEEERTRLEAQMREVQKLESLGVLAGGIAHDFNNLLMAILGNADLAMLALSPASPARPHVEEISRGSLRAADLCRQMLAYSGKGRFVIGRYDLAEIVQEMAQMLKVSVSKKANLRYSFTADLPAVEVDATQMRQVIMNLIINASEALEDQNGFISVSTGVMDCDRDYLAESYLDDNLPEGKYVYLEVADTGCGMDDDTRRRIFDPFFTTKFTGRGLGLAAVLGIVRGHQGAIKVYSEPGQGTTFKALFPAVDWAPGERAAGVTPDSRPLPGGTILLVDDDSHVRQVVSQMLERLGFKVLTAAHGREGLEVFKANGAQIDCVILDLTMPEMAGDEVFRELRRLRKNVRVILSSGFNEQDVTQRFAGKGFAGFIQKPYTVSTLRETLNRVFATK